MKVGEWTDHIKELRLAFNDVEEVVTGLCELRKELTEATGKPCPMLDQCINRLGYVSTRVRSAHEAIGGCIMGSSVSIQVR